LSKSAISAFVLEFSHF